MKVFALIMAGGRGSRMGAGKAKQSLKLSGKKIFRITAERFDSFKCIEGIVFVGRKEDISEYKKDLKGLNKIFEIVEGGKTRQESVANGLAALGKYSPDIVTIHDAVRPFVEEHYVEKSIKAARKFGAAVVVSECNDTIGVIKDGFLENVPERSKLRNLQTPQTFRYEMLLKAHNNIKRTDKTFTDDTGAAIGIGLKIKVIEGSSGNIKITSPQDIGTANFILKG